MPPKKGYKRPRRAYQRKPRVGRKSSVSSAVKAYVKKAIHVDEENKMINTNASDDFGSITNSSTMNMYPILPYVGYSTLSQGVLSNNRIGNEVKIRKVMLKYVLRPNPYDVTTNTVPIPQVVDMYLGYVKQSPGFLPSATDLTYLFQNGSSSTAPAGNLNDLIYDINKDFWNVKKRWQHKIGYSAMTGTGGNAGNQYFQNNDFKFNVVKKLNITKHVTKTMKFTDAVASLQGTNLFFFYQTLRADGLATGATQTPVHIDFWIDVTYEDA